MTIGIIGYGVIGKAVHKLFPDAIAYDKTDSTNAEFDYAFVCVSTPHNHNGVGLDMSIVEEVVKLYDADIFVICSTLQPGTADMLAGKYNKRIVIQPEYFGESTAHPLTDLAKQPFLILGGDKEDVDKVIQLYQTVYNANTRIRRVTRLEAEVIKLSENRAIAFKVAQCQELYDACLATGVDYNTVREAVYGDDPRFNLWWTFVYPDRRGFNSKCIPKDVYGWQHWAGDAPLTSALLKYNEKLIGSSKNGKKNQN